MMDDDDGKVGCGDMDLFGQAQHGEIWRALVNEVMNLLVP
jgi:hypothetical protein